jgi:hypothetical protein
VTGDRFHRAARPLRDDRYGDGTIVRVELTRRLM